MGASFVLVCIALIAAASCAQREAPPAPAVVTAPTPVPSVPTPPSAPKLECTGARGARGEWVRGPSSKLCSVVIETPRHDVSHGKSRLIFEPDSGMQIVHERGGIYTVLGYSPAARAFVIGGEYEIGATVFMEQLAAIDERSGALRLSRYRPELRILAAVMSPDGDALALIAAPRNDGKYELWLYRPAQDALFELGPAPAPPPSDFECDRPSARRWADVILQQGYGAMDEGVITFPNATRMRVTYGRDTCRARAERRTAREWDLAKVGKRWMQPVIPGEER